MQSSRLTHIDSYIQTITGNKALPYPITVSPATPDSVSQGFIALRRIRRIVRSIIFNRFAQGKMLNRF